MEFEFRGLRTRVARRIFFFFFIFALGPVTLSTAISFFSVQNQLLQDSQNRLAGMNKNAKRAITARFRFLFLKADLVLVPMAQASREVGWVEGPISGDSLVTQGFEAAVVVEEGKEIRVLLGSMPAPAPPDEEEELHLRTGEPLIRVQVEGGDPEILLAIPLGEAARLWVRVDQAFLWETAAQYSSLHASAGLFILEPGGTLVYSSIPDPKRFLSVLEENRQRLLSQGVGGPLGTLEWTDRRGQEYRAVVQGLFLKANFGLPGFFVSVSELRSWALAPMESYRSSFLIVAALAIVLVAFFSIIQIRKNLRPLEALQKGTRRIAAGDFKVGVSVPGGDEFGELADSFNAMAGRLEVQFQALETISEIDRAILSAPDSDQIVETVLRRSGDLLSSDLVAVCRLDNTGSSEGRLRIFGSGDLLLDGESRILLSPEAMAFLDTADGVARLSPENRIQGFFGDWANEPETLSALVSPIRVRKGLAGYMAACRVNGGTFQKDDLSHLLQISEPLAVGLDNASLLEEVQRMSWGALTALARAIDAKSPWTAGHSERVTNVSVALARFMNLGEDTITNLHRGGLVHDLGKIGVPSEILNWNGPLSPEQRRIVETHPQAGVTILEPIPAMEGIIPIVLYHHENWDGTGYPAGLAGEDIPFEARILSVADRFDALTTDRPYRKGWGRLEVRGWLQGEAGSGLDAELVAAFVQLLDAGGVPLPSDSGAVEVQ